MQRAGAAERDEREVPRIVAALDGDDPERTQHLGVHDLDHVGRIEAFERPLRRLAVELDAAGEPPRQATEQEVRVRDRRPLAAAAVAGGPRRRTGALGPTRTAPPASRQTIEPPPAPTVWMSTIGSLIGNPPTDRSSVRSARPPEIRHTSVEVPPMSNEIAFSTPASSATRAAPTTPPAGPETSTSAACSAASLDRRHAAGGAHHERLRQARVAAAVRERAEVAGADRAEVGVRGGRRGALVLPELGRDLVRGDDVHARQAPP